jgi:hypothetical protein
VCRVRPAAMGRQFSTELKMGPRQRPRQRLAELKRAPRGTSPSSRLVEAVSFADSVVGSAISLIALGTALHPFCDTACYTPRIVHITCTTHRLKDTRTMHHYTRHTIKRTPPAAEKPYDHLTPPLREFLALRPALGTAVTHPALYTPLPHMRGPGRTPRPPARRRAAPRARALKRSGGRA